MAFIIALLFCLVAVGVQNVWVAIGGILAALLIQSSQFNWLHHHMHHPHEDHDKEDLR